MGAGPTPLRGVPLGLRGRRVAARAIGYTAQVSLLIEIAAPAPPPGLAEALRQAAAAGLNVRFAPAAEAPLSSAVRADYERVLRERRAARGWDAAEIRLRAADPVWRAVIRLLRAPVAGTAAGHPAALLLIAPQSASLSAADLLEPARGMSVAPLRLALTADGAAAFALLAAAPAAPGAAAAVLTSGRQAIRRALDLRLTPVVVHFSHAADAQAAAVESAVRAHGEAQAVELYSPFFYDHGMLRAARVLAAVREKVPAPLIWAPQLGAAFPAALAAAPPAGTALTGTWLAGAERPIAWAESAASAATLSATLRLLARAAAAA